MKVILIICLSFFGFTSANAVSYSVHITPSDTTKSPAVQTFTSPVLSRISLVDSKYTCFLSDSKVRLNDPTLYNANLECQVGKSYEKFRINGECDQKDKNKRIIFMGLDEQVSEKNKLDQMGIKRIVWNHMITVICNPESEAKPKTK